MTFIKNSICINRLTYLLFVILFFLDKLNFFLTMYFFVLMHELSHILVAKFYKINVKKISITPIGIYAILEDLTFATKNTRLLIYIAGPLFNIIIALLFFILNSNAHDLIMFNLLIGIFNLLPIFPLDGGNIAHLIFENKFGTLRVGKVLAKVTKCFSYVIMFLGVIQLCLFPFNCSLFVLGIYINISSKREYTNISNSFFCNMLKKRTASNVKYLVLKKDIALYDLIQKFSKNLYYIVIIKSDYDFVYILENEIYDSLLNNSSNIMVSDLLNDFNEN